VLNTEVSAEISHIMPDAELDNTVGIVGEDGFDEFLLLIHGTALHRAAKFLQNAEVISIEEDVLAEAELVMKDVVRTIVHAPGKHPAALHLSPLPRSRHLAARRDRHRLLHGNVFPVHDVVAGVGALREEEFRDLDDGLEVGGDAIDDAAELILLHRITVFQFPVRDAVKVIKERLTMV